MHFTDRRAAKIKFDNGIGCNGVVNVHFFPKVSLQCYAVSKEGHCACHILGAAITLQGCHINNGSFEADNRIIIIPAINRIYAKSATDHIISGAAINCVIAIAAKDLVVTVTPVKNVIVVVAFYIVVAVAAIDCVIAIAAEQDIIVCAAVYCIATVTADNRIITVISIEEIADIAAINNIIAGSAIYNIGTTATANAVITVLTVKNIIPVTAEDAVITGTGKDNIVTLTAIENIITAIPINCIIASTAINDINGVVVIHETGIPFNDVSKVSAIVIPDSIRPHFSCVFTTAIIIRFPTTPVLILSARRAAAGGAIPEIQSIFCTTIPDPAAFRVTVCGA